VKLNTSFVERLLATFDGGSTLQRVSDLTSADGRETSISMCGTECGTDAQNDLFDVFHEGSAGKSCL
jgi:hypothetical protein